MMKSGLFDRDNDTGTSVPLLGVEVRAEVVAGHACAVVRQRYRNDAKQAVEAVYTFPLPTKAVLTGFSMTVEGRRLEGEVHEREEAFRRYDDAISAGHGGALLEQERPNVFTANVGNLLPGEETVIEVQYVEPLLADEGAVRWAIPTLVAPRYVPGVSQGDRTAHGTSDPTDRVPDADRVSPPQAASVPYGLALDLTFDLGVPLELDCRSHAVVIRHEGPKAHVTFAQREVPLDRDVVITARAKGESTSLAPIASAVTHRAGDAVGIVGLTLVPDLGGAVAERRRERGQDVVFLLDRSGSMGGASMPEARSALRLCLRQLREGDRFDILAFDDSVETMSRAGLVPFTQRTLQEADAWLESIDARGGTEMLGPMLTAAKLAPSGVIVLLTDGAVANEDEILAAFMQARTSARVYSFGIGTNVSDALLQALGDRTGGAVEMIHPGERIDDKVVAQFARATAPRVTDVTIKTRGIELGEMAPAEARPLVDGEPYTVFATYETAGRGVVEIRGKLDGGAFFLEVPVDLDPVSDRPVVAKLWAQARIVDLERSIASEPGATGRVTGRRADAMKDRIVKLAIEHGVSSRFTSFVVVEKRTGDRRMNAQPETSVVPVNVPAGWATQGQKKGASTTGAGVMKRMLGAAPSMRAMSPHPASMPLPRMPAPMRGGGGVRKEKAAPMPASKSELFDAEDVMTQSVASRDADGFASQPMPELASEGGGLDVRALLARQAASGLWEEPGRHPVAATAVALLSLVRLGLSTADPVHGSQIKKAIDALLALLATQPAAPVLVEVALGAGWLLASGHRTRQSIEQAARALPNLAAAFASEPAVRAHVDQLDRGGALA